MKRKNNIAIMESPLSKNSLSPLNKVSTVLCLSLLLSKKSEDNKNTKMTPNTNISMIRITTDVFSSVLRKIPIKKDAIIYVAKNHRSNTKLDLLNIFPKSVESRGEEPAVSVGTL